MSANILGLIKGSVTTLATPGAYNVVKRTGNRPQAMLQGLVNNTLDEKLDSVEWNPSFSGKFKK